MKTDVEAMRERFTPGARFEGLQAGAVGKIVEDALFRAAMKGITLNMRLDVDNFHVVVTVIDAEPDDEERPPYDD